MLDELEFAEFYMPVIDTYVFRLEAATSRLEDMAASLEGPSPSSPPLSEALQTAPSQPLPQPASLPSLPPPTEELPRPIEAFDELINNEVKPFVETAQKIGDAVAEQVDYPFNTAFLEIGLIVSVKMGPQSFRSRTEVPPCFDQG